MKHLFVPYGLAELAKEKGFDEECLTSYWTRDGDHYREGELETMLGPLTSDLRDLFLKYNSDPKLVIDEICAAPLYQQLIDWFREKHNIVVEAAYSGSVDNFMPKLIPMNTGSWKFVKESSQDYYEALNKAIEEAFKLIK